MIICDIFSKLSGKFVTKSKIWYNEDESGKDGVNVMKSTNGKNQIIEVLETRRIPGGSFFLKDMYGFFPQMKPGTVRENLRRLVNEKRLIRIKSGTYAFPESSPILGFSELPISDVIRKKYLIDSDGRRIGYFTGINLANSLGLTTQTAPVQEIVSNAISPKKRTINFQNHRVIIEAPRVPITDENYKILQILDLLGRFGDTPEENGRDFWNVVSAYLSQVNLSRDQIEDIISHYPLQTQIQIYKSGVLHEIAR